MRLPFLLLCYPSTFIYISHGEIDDNCLNCSEYPWNDRSCYDDEQDNCPTDINCARSLIWKGCYSCSGRGEDATCLTCNSGFSLQGGECDSCPEGMCCKANLDPVDIGCEECNVIGTECISCPNGEQPKPDGTCLDGPSSSSSSSSSSNGKSDSSSSSSSSSDSNSGSSDSVGTAIFPSFLVVLLGCLISVVLL